MVSKTVYDIGREVCLKQSFFYIIGNFDGIPYDMKKSSGQGSHCGGRVICRRSDPPQAENPVNQDSFLYIYRDTKMMKNLDKIRGEDEREIIRVLNTNAVVSVDSQGMELIMTGPGIGFKKRKGENIDQSLVDKTYHLENKEESKRLQEVVKEISEEYLGIVDRVVKEAKKEKLE